MATRVLIVENDAETCANLRGILETDCYQTDVSTTAADAIRRINLMPFDLIIIDWHLPDMNTNELLRRLNRHAPDASVIVATGCSDVEHAIDAMHHGASDYIVKPICPELLLGSVRRARKLQSAQRRASQAERLAVVGNAVASVAHESRGALQCIRSRVELIRMMHTDDANLLEDLESIENASAHLQLYFEELCQFSVPVILQKTACGIRELVNRVWHNLTNGGTIAGAHLVVPAEEILCRIDKIRIEQVMRNLFENAIDACDAVPRIEVDWTVDTSSDQEMVVITVRDNGSGFTAEQRTSAFKPFFTTKSHGSGLGLAICRRIIEAHGGTIEMEDQPNYGAAIAITLPRHLCDDTPKTKAKAIAYP